MDANVVQVLSDGHLALPEQMKKAFADVKALIFGQFASESGRRSIAPDTPWSWKSIMPATLIVVLDSTVHES